MRALALATALTALLAAPASAYRLMDVVPQPRVLYYVQLKDWRKPMARAAKAVNRAHVGVRLVKSAIPENASVQIGRLDKGCGLAGIDATTQNLEGGYAVIYLPRGCHGAQASIIAAHELGHALGLKHEDRRCALMNSSGTGPRSIPTNCLGGSYDWLRHPFRSDDLAGLRKLYRNTKPKVTLELTGPATVAAGTPVTFAIKTRDREDNLSQVKVDYGDGSADERLAGEALPTSHAYAVPGRYTIRVTALDFYLERGHASAAFTVTG